jgi:hypothetical protein
MGDDQGGDWNGEVVQATKGLWIHSADRGDVHEHILAAVIGRKAGLSTLNEGAKASYEEVPNKGRPRRRILRVR